MSKSGSHTTTGTTVPSKPKFCVDCEHHTVIAAQHYCRAAVCLVTGTSDPTECWRMRLGQECGNEGRLFVSKQARDR